MRWVIAASVVVALLLPSQAAGHATLLSSAPVAETVVEGSPSRLVLRFSEPVVVVSGDIKVFDGVAGRVAIGKVERPRPTEVIVPVSGELERGSYTVVWRVISADLDSINGFFVFHVGADRGAVEAGGTAPAAADDGPGPATLVLPALVLLGAAAAGIALRRRPRLRLVPAVAGAAALAVLALVAAGGGENTSAARGETFRADVQMGTLAATVSVAPAQIGANRIELALPRPEGTEGGYFEVRVVATLPSAGLGPLRFTGIQGTDPGQFAVRQANLPLPGDWQLRVSARRGLEDRFNGTVALPIKTAQ